MTEKYHIALIFRGLYTCISQSLAKFDYAKVFSRKRYEMVGVETGGIVLTPT